MNDQYQYRLSQKQKIEIAQNLIDILQKDAKISIQTTRFVGDWILTGSEEKRKAFFDVWDIVLKNYIPTTRPILFRTCHRIGKNGKIASFTGQLECARRISRGKGTMIICDTKEALEFEEKFYKIGEYKHTFYPLVNVLIKDRDSGECVFSELILRYIGEEEYIMRINSGRMNLFKWAKNDF